MAPAENDVDEQQLVDFLRASATAPFVYGKCDCALWVCNWIKLRLGLDPGARFRGRYHTRAGCAKLLMYQGGLLQLARRAFERAGLCTIEPGQSRAGDVGCIMTEDGPALAICAGPRWVWKGGEGLLASSNWPVLRVWRV